jgi:hypothetical protein
VIGLVVSDALNEFVFDTFDAYGEVPIPGTRTLHLPAGDVTVSFNASHIADVGLPDDLEMTITPPSGVAEPTVTQDSRRNQTSWRVAHIAQAGDYTITTNGKVTDYDSPRLRFGHPSRFEFLGTLFEGLTDVMAAVLVIWVLLWVLKSVVLTLRGPTFTGAPVQGTGQVLSMQETGFQIGGGETGSPLTQVRYQIALRVQLPGRAPYDTTIRQLVGMVDGRPNLGSGATVVLAADSANPQNVRIDFH